MRRAPLAFVFLAALYACGSRTGLPIDDQAAPDDAGATPMDATADARPSDAGPDTRPVDAAPDVIPPIDASRHDAGNRSDCPDADATLVYVLTQQNELYSFYPPTATFTRIGVIACPSGGATPWSMTVDRKGIAYSVFSNGALFRLSTATAACRATSYAPGQLGFQTFGMGYVANTSDPGETLYVAENTFNQDSRGLGAIDTTTFRLRLVAPFAPPIPRAELTGTGDGRLFGFYPNTATNGSHVVEIDKETGRIVGDSVLRVGEPNDAFAFAFWGGDFWIFTSPGGASQVTRFRPSDGSEVVAGSMPSTIVGAGVSTCAPQ